MKVKRTKFQCKRDEKTIRGKRYAPEGSGLPILIISHGFMANSKSVEHYAKTFAQEGYACYIYDFCGGCVHGKSDGATTEMSVFTESEDLKAVIRYAKADDGTDERRITLMGCSQGGFVSGIVAAELGGEIEKLIMYYPALCIPDDARAGSMMFAKFDPENIPEVIKCGPMKLGRCYPQSVLDKQPEELICGYRGPVQIIHGTADRVVNISYSRRVAEQFKNASLTVIENAGHGFRKQDDVFAIDCTRQFLREGVRKGGK